MLTVAFVVHAPPLAAAGVHDSDPRALDALNSRALAAELHARMLDAENARLREEVDAANAENLFFVGLNGILVIFLISLIIFLSNPFLLLIPVPTAVPPCAKK